MFAVRPMFSSGGIVNPLPGGTFSAARATTCTSNARFNVDGTVDHVIVGSSTFKHYWHTGGGDTSLYIRFTLVSGDTPNNGTLNTWQQLNSARSIGFTVSGPGTIRSATIRVQIATDAAGTNIIADSGVGGGYNIDAEVP